MANKRRPKDAPPVDLDAERSRLIDREWDARSRVLAVAAVVVSVGEDDAHPDFLRHPLEMLREAWAAYRKAGEERQEFDRRVRS